MNNEDTGGQSANAAGTMKRGRISGRLVWAIISTTLEQTSLVLIFTMALPRWGMNVPMWALPPVMIGWLAYTVTMYRKGSRALEQQPMVGLPDMVGAHGEVVRPLAPDGMVKIRGELWAAVSANGNVSSSRKIVVVGQDRLQLVVRETDRPEPHGPE